ncbi:MAG: hypothetical protein KY437_01800, partial [Actinobacteria bacterium]|nr:hypothetical protein [Actinomycetota bacterium]
MIGRMQVPLLLAAVLVLTVNGVVVLDRSGPTSALTVGDGGLTAPSPAPNGMHTEDNAVIDVLSRNDPGRAEGDPPP